MVAAARVDAPVVIRHSMGALVALECAARGLASTAVLLDSAPILDARGKGYFRRSVAAVAADDGGQWRPGFRRQSPAGH